MTCRIFMSVVFESTVNSPPSRINVGRGFRFHRGEKVMKSDIGTCLSVIAMVCMAVPAQAFNEQVTATPKAQVSDVVLTDSGDFLGLVVADDGNPRANVPVRVYFNDTVVAEAKTDASGRYFVRGIRTGLHLVRTSTTEQACRFWNANSAPPSARQALVTSSQTSIVRGQYACGEDCGEGCDGGMLGGGCGLLGGAGVGTFAAVGLFAGVTAVTIASSTKSSKSQANVPASP